MWDLQQKCGRYILTIYRVLSLNYKYTYYVYDLSLIYFNNNNNNNNHGTENNQHFQSNLMVEPLCNDDV